MQKLRCFFTTILICSMLSGCWGAKEIEHLIYVNSIGVDYVKGKFVFYTQIISFGNIAKQEAGGQRLPQTISIGKGEGKTLDEAIFNLYPTAQQRLSWSHIKAIVFSEAALKQDVVNQLLDVVDRYYEFRYTIWTFATKEPIEDIFNAKPILNISVLYSQLNDPQDIYRQSSVVAPMYLYKFIWKWKESGQTMQLPEMGINKVQWTEDKKKHPKLIMSGVCFLQNKKLKQCIPRADIMGLRWLDKDTSRPGITVYHDGHPIATLVMEKIKPSITPKVENDKVTFQLKVSTKANMPQLVKAIPEKKLREYAEKSISEEIMHTYLLGQKSQIDVLQLSDTLYRENPKAWHQFTKNGELPLRPDTISRLDVELELFGGNLSKIREH
ncbi:Ger(x)C family spore germination protein [Brevibacillus sp. NPDC003359]|uniref:Ger(x)C family spore germination protein n=1 Tax=unclassified Brevibacillus TaxID=2684853 RepID=UPI0036B06D5C